MDQSTKNADKLESRSIIKIVYIILLVIEAILLFVLLILCAIHKAGAAEWVFIVFKIAECIFGFVCVLLISANLFFLSYIWIVVLSIMAIFNIVIIAVAVSAGEAAVAALLLVDGMFLISLWIFTFIFNSSRYTI